MTHWHVKGNQQRRRKADAVGPARSTWRLSRCEGGEPDPRDLVRVVHKDLKQSSMSTVDTSPSRGEHGNQGMEAPEQEMSKRLCAMFEVWTTNILVAFPAEGEFVLAASVCSGSISHKARVF